MSALPFEEFKEANEDLGNIRKVLGSALLVAPYSAPVPFTTFVGANGALSTIDPAYKRLGLITPDGVEFPNEQDTVETRSFGHLSPTRIDKSGSTFGVNFSLQEVDLQIANELAHNVDLSEVTPDANGNLKWDIQDNASMTYWRLLVIVFDVSTAEGTEVLRAKFFSKVTVVNAPTETWGEDALSLPFEFRAFHDSAFGKVGESYLAGRGLNLSSLGYSVSGA